MARFTSKPNGSLKRLLAGLVTLLVVTMAFLCYCAVDTAWAGKKSKADYESDLVSTYFSPFKTSRKNMQKYTELMREINERNAAVEDSQAWIGEAYKGIHLRNLINIPKSEYANYKKYAGKKGRIYIIVHPAYYTFFGKGDMTEHPLISEFKKTEKVISNGGEYPKKNLVERLYDKMALDETLFVMQEQERLLRDFVEVYSTKGALVLLVLPRNYQKILYGYSKGHDEYARYINEISNEADNVIYMESVTATNGEITYEDLDVLMAFLEANDIETIAMGGGYVGRCLEGFYDSIIDAFGHGHIYQIPEIVAVSPDDIQGRWGNNLITQSGRLNLVQLHRNLLTDGAYNKVRTIPKLKHFYMYKFLKAKLARKEGERMNVGGAGNVGNIDDIQEYGEDNVDANDASYNSNDGE